ncbi:hypothetical protein MJ1_0286 [Nanobdella aerobiophila]|uniref:Uncharacterized protein n=1 Tax=Nanobdella aerobiophila TaxID=2586965 RepID=A0A915SZT6_9ARCH|nr:SufD family Fe-S cluster assembly protein [Nanobdella aerobiophila]BBL45454.1 hypothetical protein MJ1_0286 [Nanobdella aerobiophila]
MDSQYFKDLFRKYYDKEFDRYNIIENIYNTENININPGNNIYINKFYINSENLNIIINNQNKAILYNEFIVNKNVNINFLLDNNKEIYIYNLYNIYSNINSKFDEKIYNKNKAVIISRIYIPHNSENSDARLNQIVYDENGISILLPILDVFNKKSRGFHGSKTLKLNNKEIEYLNYLSLSKEDIKNILIKEFLKI